MSRHRLLRLDVFADRPGAGNPLAVVLDADDLDSATMQAIARWNRLPETTFVLAAEGQADYRLRIFSPQHEVPFAGHPSIGTAHALIALDRVTPAADGRLWQIGAAGRLPLQVQGDGRARRVAIRTPRTVLHDTATATHADALAAACRDWPPGTLPPLLAEGGRRWWCVHVANDAALRALAPDWAAIGTLARSSASMGVCAFAFTAAGSTHDLVVRAFVGSATPFEDAASGAANAILAARLAHAGALPGHAGRYRVSQGREVGFDATLELAVDGDGEVWSGGQACLLLDGWLDW